MRRQLPLTVVRVTKLNACYVYKTTSKTRNFGYSVSMNVEKSWHKVLILYRSCYAIFEFSSAGSDQSATG